jgi:hypothetical protein
MTGPGMFLEKLDKYGQRFELAIFCPEIMSYY